MPHSSPDSNPDLYSTAVTAMLYAISCYTGPRYNGTGLYLLYSPTRCSYLCKKKISSTLSLNKYFSQISTSLLKFLFTFSFPRVFFLNGSIFPALMVRLFLNCFAEDGVRFRFNLKQFDDYYICKHYLQMKYMGYSVEHWVFNKILKQDGINTLRPRQNGRHFPDDIFKCIFLNENT